MITCRFCEQPSEPFADGVLLCGECRADPTGQLDLANLRYKDAKTDYMDALGRMDYTSTDMQRYQPILRHRHTCDPSKLPRHWQRVREIRDNEPKGSFKDLLTADCHQEDMRVWWEQVQEEYQQLLMEAMR